MRVEPANTFSARYSNRPGVEGCDRLLPRARERRGAALGAARGVVCAAAGRDDAAIDGAGVGADDADSGGALVGSSDDDALL